MKNNFLSEEINYLQKANKIIIGLSGGADSIALTHILLSAFGPDRLICCHVNHMIRGEEADHDEMFVRNFCASHGIKLEVLKKDIPSLSRELKLGSEECGRLVRYNFFNEIASNENDVICTAHNADDNAETVLLNIIRGSALNGLSGIPKKRGKIYRPILSMTRDEIETYCNKNSLSFVTDSTNLQDEYTRNKIRHAVIPALKEINQSVVGNITKMTTVVSEENDYLNSLADKLLGKSKTKYGYNSLLLALEDDVIIRRAVIKMIADYSDVKPEAKHLSAAVNVIKNGGSADICGNIHIENKQGVFTLSKKEKSKELVPLELTAENTVSIFNKNVSLSIEKADNHEKINNLLFINCIDYDKIKCSLKIGSRIEGDSITLPRRKVKKTLKKLFSENKIPASVRNKVIVIHDGENVVFVEGFGVDLKYAVTPETKTIAKININEVNING